MFVALHSQDIHRKISLSASFNDFGSHKLVVRSRVVLSSLGPRRVEEALVLWDFFDLLDIERALSFHLVF